MSKAPPRLILASASPRRRQILRRCGLSFTTHPGRLHEDHRAGESPRRRARRLAIMKARAIAVRLRKPAWVMGSDTIVVVGDHMLGKPRDDPQAARMLARLSGRWHSVISAVALLPARIPDGQAHDGWRLTRVRFSRLTPEHIRWILEAREHRDKAGAYAVQGRAGAFIREIRGSCSNVAGLPLELAATLLGRAGFLPAPSGRRTSHS
ncbi:MAG: Maf family protein [Acidobacteriota bacterium]